MDKVSIIGSGNVGANAAFFIVEKGITDVVLYDIQDGLAMGKALDIMEAAPIRKYRNRIRGTDNFGDLSDSETIVIAAGRGCVTGIRPDSLLADNWRSVKEIVRELMKVSPESVIIVATEPVDAITTLIVREFRLPIERVLGLGGILEAARFQALVAGELSVSAENISVMAVGRHTHSMLLLPAYTRVSGIPLADLLSGQRIRELKREAGEGGNLITELSECPGSYYTPSAAIVEVVDAIHMDLKRIFPLSVMLAGEYGIDGIALTLPCVVGKGGVERILLPALTETEADELRQSAGEIEKILAGSDR
jgi:malate dehydrogenase